ncbi:hypothetical protein L195_g062262, partial [Trifolium pratense]
SFSNSMIFNLDVFGSSMLDWILCYGNNRFAIHPYDSSFALKLSHI